MSSARRSLKKPKIMFFLGAGTAVPARQPHSPGLRGVIATRRSQRPLREFSTSSLWQWERKAESARHQLEQTGSLPDSMFDFE